jgi:hypothetical protein
MLVSLSPISNPIDHYSVGVRVQDGVQAAQAVPPLVSRPGQGQPPLTDLVPYPPSYIHDPSQGHFDLLRTSVSAFCHALEAKY